MSIPIISRLSFWDYQRIFLAFLLLTLESIARFILFFIPVPLIKFIKSNVLKYGPKFLTSYGSDKYHSSFAYLDTCQIIEHHGFPFEEHTAVTSDGYFLILHRIPYGRTETRATTSHVNREGKPHPSKKPAILLMHGCMMSSEIWVCYSNTKKCYPFVLADLGFDVWMGNFRGNKYSHKHTFLKPSEKAFWDFSLDELALYDIPCMINYILKSTGLASLSYIGFSQGSAVCFSALSIHKSLNTKINTIIALAATTVPKGFENPFTTALIKASPEIVYLIFGRDIFLPVTLFWKEHLGAIEYACLVDFCLKSLFKWKCQNISLEDKTRLYPHLYSCTSSKLIVHWFQIMRAQRLQMYDDGMSLFGRGHISPAYRLKDIKTPIYAFYGSQDTLIDISTSLKEFPDTIQTITVEHYEHLDFLWSNDIDSFIMPIILPLLMSQLDHLDEFQKNNASAHDGHLNLSSSSSLSSDSERVARQEKRKSINDLSLKHSLLNGFYEKHSTSNLISGKFMYRDH